MWKDNVTGQAFHANHLNFGTSLVKRDKVGNKPRKLLRVSTAHSHHAACYCLSIAFGYAGASDDSLGHDQAGVGTECERVGLLFLVDRLSDPSWLDNFYELVYCFIIGGEVGRSGYDICEALQVVNLTVTLFGLDSAIVDEQLFQL